MVSKNKIKKYLGETKCQALFSISNYYQSVFKIIFIDVCCLYKINNMSTIQLQQPSSKLIHFKSTNYMDRPHHLPTHRKRNNSTNISVYQTIGDPFSRSDSQSFQNKLLVQTNLPDIHSKKKSRKRSSLLEMWLDQALDPQENEQSKNNVGLRVQVDKTGPLRTVQKFEIDKKYLKSLNISQEAIDKIYNSLYVYTYGINNTFEDILKLTKVSQHSEKKIVNNFWKAFIKLLEGCTSFRTCFQVIEEGHLKNLAEAKDTYMKRESKLNSQKQTLQQENLKLLKKINEQSYLLSKITSDYNISQATLQLTDQAFNDEVNLRLKFEEKVNSMFSSYEELRVKYDRLIHQLHVNKDQFSQFRKIEINLKQQLEQTSIRLEQTKKQLARAYQVINQRQQQISIKRQEIFLLEGQVYALKQQKQEQQEERKKILSKANNFQLLADEYKAQANYKTIILAQVEKRLAQQDNIIIGCREANQKLYNRLEESSTNISNLQKQLITTRIAQKQAQERKQATQRYARTNESENFDLHSKIQILEKQLSLTKDELSIKNKQVERNTELIGDLQAVNLKFQTLYQTTSTEKKKMEQEMQEAVRISQRFKEEMDGMRLLLQSKTVELQEANVKLQNQREVFRSKIAAQRQQVQNKELQILQLHNKQIEDQDLVKACQNEAEDCRKAMEQYRGEIVSLSAQKIQTNLRIEEIDRQRISKYKKIRELQQQIECLKKELLQSKQLLVQKQGVISSTLGQSEAENQELRQLLEQYRQSREKKVGYIHPMLYQDCLEQINRLQAHRQQLTQNKNQLLENISILERDLQIKNTLCDQGLDRIQALSASLVNKQLELSMMLQNQTENETKIYSLTQQYKNHQKDSQEKQKKLNLQIQELNQNRTLIMKQNAQNKLLITQQSQQIHKFKEENRQICLKLRRNEGQINLLQQKLAQLQDQLKKTTSRAGHRTSQAARKKHVSQSEKSQKQELKQETQLNIIKQKQQQQIQSPEKATPVNPQPSKYILQKSTADKEVQTQKKYSHAHKFEISGEQPIEKIRFEEKEQIQEEIIQSKKSIKKPQLSLREQQRKKIDPGQFKKALKFTFMRR